VARVEVALPGRSYPVFIGQGALQELPKLVREMGVSGAAIVTDTTVGKAWGGAVETGLTGVGVNCRTLAVEPGEGSKSLAELERVLAFLEELRIDRRGIVLALGGGTVGDLAGFAAAVWLPWLRRRGAVFAWAGAVLWVVPTFLLALAAQESPVPGLQPHPGRDQRRLRGGEPADHLLGLGGAGHETGRLPLPPCAGRDRRGLRHRTT